MNILNMKGGARTPLDAVVAGLTGNLKRNAGQYKDERLGKALMALESMSEGDQQFAYNQSQTLQNMIIESFDELKEQGISLNLAPDGASEGQANDAAAVASGTTAGLNESQLQAATIVAMSASDPSSYALAATNTAVPAALGTAIDPLSTGVAGDLDHRNLVMTQESFGEQPLREMLSWSILFNAASARQDAFAEAFYRTVVITPNEAGISLTVARSMVVGTPFHKLDGRPNDLDRRNLIEAARHPEILEDESTRIYPVVAEDGSVDQFFVNPTQVAPKTIVQEQFELRTAPLKFGKVGLINISTPQFLRETGIMDLTDAISGGARLDNLYLQVGDDVLKYAVKGLATAGFIKSVEGSSRKLNIFFETEDLVITAETVAIDGSETALASLLKNPDGTSLTARVGVTVSGTLDTQTSELSLNASYEGLTSLLDENGLEIGTRDNLGKRILEALADGKALGYDIYAVRTNENRRQRGLLLDQLEERFVYAIPLTAPISVPSPVGSSRPAQHLEALIAAQRLRCSNDAVTSLLNHAGALREYMAGTRRRGAVPTIGSAGRLMVSPFYDYLEIDALKVVQSLNDKDRAQDIASLLVNAIKDMGVRMMIGSAYPAALAATLTGSKTPRLIVGTDNLIAQHLMVQGDLRTFGVIFKDPVLVATLNEKMDGRIIIALTRDAASNVPDPLQFGWHAWIPELVSIVQVSRYGNTTNEAQVQSRYLHINNLPILGEIVVKNLSEALVTRLPYAVDATVRPAQDGAGQDGTKSTTGSGSTADGTASASGTGAGTTGTNSPATGN